MFHNVNNELFRTVPNSASSSSSSFDDIISATTTNKTTLGSEITTDDIYGLCNGTAQRKETPISQFASRVLEFSSQYGSDNSISYTACNITGRPSKFPVSFQPQIPIERQSLCCSNEMFFFSFCQNYGDFPETFAMVSTLNIGNRLKFEYIIPDFKSIVNWIKFSFYSALMENGGIWRLLALLILCHRQSTKLCHKTL